MNTYGLLGYPLGHSFSRKFFLDKFQGENIKASFENFELADAKDILPIVENQEHIKGFAITLPHKENIIPLLHQVDAAIDSIGAVNCVRVERIDGQLMLKGYNTDVIGFEESFKEHLTTQHKKALVLGTGGASKAVVYVLNRLGITPIMVSRTKTESTLSYADITPELMKDIQVVVNTTPLGMHPKVEACPDLPYDEVTKQHYFYDLVYNPEETLFLAKAKAQGATIKCGMDMLELQAEANWHIWNQA